MLRIVFLHILECKDSNCHVFFDSEPCYCVICHLYVFPHISSTDFGDLTVDATHGLNSVLNRRLHAPKGQHKEAVNVYSGIAAMEPHLLHIQEDVEEWDDNGYTSPESEEEDD